MMVRIDARSCARSRLSDYGAALYGTITTVTFIELKTKADHRPAVLVVHISRALKLDVSFAGRRTSQGHMQGQRTALQAVSGACVI